MSDFTLTVPQHLVERARKIAERSERPLEDVLLNQIEYALNDPLSFLPAEERQEPEALNSLSDSALRTAAREQMPLVQQERMQVLMDKNNFGTISGEEYEELSSLVDLGNRLTLRKAKAAALLHERGYKITPEMMAGNDE